LSGKGSWRLAVEESFSAAHALRNYGGKCENMHGHNYGVTAVVRGEKLDPDVGIVMDFGELRAALKAILSGLDHRNLSETPPFDTLNPSSENIAAHIYKELVNGLTGRGVEVVSVEVAEKPGQSAIYSEEG
jgi:6-pyruvoyltetrahydropterin/6-carboxytetrahydropterin synthase